MKSFISILTALLLCSCFMEQDKKKAVTIKGYNKRAMITEPDQNRQLLDPERVDNRGLSTNAENIIIPDSHWQPLVFYDGMARVVDTTTGLYGFISQSGNLDIPCIYSSAFNFNDSLALVRDCESGKCGFINQKNEVVIPFIYDEAYSFNRGMYDDFEGFYGLAMVNIGNTPDNIGMMYTEGKWGLINKMGEEVLPIKYGYIFPVVYGVAFILYGTPVREIGTWEGKFGIIDNGGEIIVPPIYDSVSNFVFEDRIVTVKKGNQRFNINTMGEVVCELK